MILKEAEARVKQRKIEFSAAKKLSIKGFKTETKFAAAFADLQEAKATQITKASVSIIKIFFKFILV